MKHRDRIMGNMGSLLDNVEFLLCQLDRQENYGTVDETDKEFMTDLNRIRPALVKFYYDWEERY